MEKFLWHGTPKRMKGETLLPRKAIDKCPENSQLGVYATESRDVAIAVALRKCDGVSKGNVKLDGDPPYGIMFIGWPSQEHIYLYKLSFESFVEVGSGQWISYEPVIPLSEEKISVDNSIHLIRKATKEEEKIFYIEFFGLLGH